jgi:predicted PurR-regulated permease PerM
VTIVSLLVGAELLGLLGLLLAIPAAAAIQIILRDWWSERARSSAPYAGEVELDRQPSGS